MPYLTKEEILTIFDGFAATNGGPFWSRVSPNVEWTIMGQGPGTGRYTDLVELRKNTLDRLQRCLAEPPQLKFVNALVSGDNSEWTTVELEAHGVCKNGMNSLQSFRWVLLVLTRTLIKGMKYHNRYCLIVKWDENGQVVQVRDYLDTATVQKVFAENDPEPAA